MKFLAVIFFILAQNIHYIHLLNPRLPNTTPVKLMAYSDLIGPGLLMCVCLLQNVLETHSRADCA
jgi:hypothetical protein